MQYGSAELRIREAKDKTKRTGMDISFLALVMILLTIGVTMVLSASFARAYFDPGGVTGGKPAYYFIRQLIFAALGVAAMIVCSRLPVGFYKRFSVPLLIAAIVLHNTVLCIDDMRTPRHDEKLSPRHTAVCGDPCRNRRTSGT